MRSSTSGGRTWMPDHVRALATAIRAAAARQARAVAMTQAGVTAQFTPSMGIDGGINRFVGHVELAWVRKDPLEGSRYLLRRPLPAEHGAHHAPAHTLPTQLAVAASTAPASHRTQLRMVGTIALPGTGVASHLASNGRRRSFKNKGDGPHTEAALSHRGNSNSVLRLKLLVRGRFLHGHTLQEKVLHFIFEAALVLLFLSGSIKPYVMRCCIARIDHEKPQHYLDRNECLGHCRMWRGLWRCRSERPASFIHCLGQ